MIIFNNKSYKNFIGKEFMLCEFMTSSFSNIVYSICKGKMIETGESIIGHVSTIPQFVKTTKICSINKMYSHNLRTIFRILFRLYIFKNSSILLLR